LGLENKSKTMTPRGGSLPQQEGKTFEELLEWTNAGYLARGRAAIYKNATASRYVGGGKIITEKSRPDFSGTLVGGVSIHFDSKSMSGVCGWRLSKRQIHQYRDLLDQAGLGAICFFLIEERASAVVYLLRVHPEIPVVDGRPELMFEKAPAADWRLKQAFDTRCYYHPSQIPAFYVEQNADGLYDWLTAVENLWMRRSTLPPRPTGRPPSEKIAKRNVKLLKMLETHTVAQVARNTGMNYQTVRSVARGRRNGQDHIGEKP